MDDRRMDQLLGDAAEHYRVPPDASFDAIWSNVEREAFAANPTPVKWMSRRLYLALAMAASLVIGVLIGRFSMSERTAIPTVAVLPRSATVTQSVNVVDPYQRTTEEFLNRSAVLLASLPPDGGGAVANDRFITQASQLLTTTRVLLDSPVGTDRRMKDLLQDLELVLAQVARIQAPRHRAELTLITEALQERDLVPRIKSAVADLSISDH